MGVLLASPLSALSVALAAAGPWNVACFATSMTHYCLETAIPGQMLCAVATVAVWTRCWLLLPTLEHKAMTLAPSIFRLCICMPVTLAFFSANSEAWHSSKAFLKVRSGSANSCRRCSLLSLTPHISRLYDISLREAPN